MAYDDLFGLMQPQVDDYAHGQIDKKINENSLLNILTGYQTAADIPPLSTTGKITPENIQKLWSALNPPIPEGVEAPGLGMLELSTGPVAGKSGLLKRIISGLTKKPKAVSKIKFPEAMVPVIEKGQPKRFFTVVEMYDDAGRKIVQPFYKSTGTSVPGQKNIRAGKWMPFLGRLATDKFAGVVPKGFYIKGRRSLAESPWHPEGAKEIIHGDVPGFAKNLPSEIQDYWLRMGSERMEEISKVLSKMEKKQMLSPLKMYKSMEGRAHYAGDLERYIQSSRYAPGTFKPQVGSEIVAKNYKDVNRILREIFDFKRVPSIY